MTELRLKQLTVGTYSSTITLYCRGLKPPAERILSGTMQWKRSDTLALAMHGCTHCLGSGLRLSRRGSLAPCNCVLRSIFRICYKRFVRCATQEKHLSRISLEPHLGQERGSSWGRKDEEYIADFMLVSRRTLADADYRLFRYHFLLGADWKLCARQMGLDRGNFFHAVYRIEQQLGRVFRELEPYSLFPLDEYFHGASRKGQVARKPLVVEPAAVLPQHLRFPPVGRTA